MPGRVPCSMANNMHGDCFGKKEASASQMDDPKVVYDRISAACSPKVQERLRNVSAACDNQKTTQRQRTRSVAPMQADCFAKKEDPQTIYERISATASPTVQDRFHAGSTSCTEEKAQARKSCLRPNQQLASSTSRRVSVTKPDDTRTVYKRISASRSPETQDSACDSPATDDTQVQESEPEHEPASEPEQPVQPASSATKKASASQPQTDLSRTSASSKKGSKDSVRRASKSSKSKVQETESEPEPVMQASSSKKVTTSQTDEPKTDVSKTSSSRKQSIKDRLRRASKPSKSPVQETESEPETLQPASSASKKVSASQQDEPKTDLSRLSASSKPGSKDQIRRDSKATGSQENVQERESCSRGNVQAKTSSNKRASASRSGDVCKVKSQTSSCNKPEGDSCQAYTSETDDTQENAEAPESCFLDEIEEDCFARRPIEMEDPKAIWERITSICGDKHQQRVNEIENSEPQECEQENGTCSLDNMYTVSYPDQNDSDCQQDKPKVDCSKSSPRSNLQGQEHRVQRSEHARGPSSKANVQSAYSASPRASASQANEPKTIYKRNSASTKPEGQGSRSHAPAANDNQKNMQEQRSSCSINQRTSSTSRKVSGSPPDDVRSGNSMRSTSKNLGGQDRASNASAASGTKGCGSCSMAKIEVECSESEDEPESEDEEEKNAAMIKKMAAECRARAEERFGSCLPPSNSKEGTHERGQRSMRNMEEASNQSEKFSDNQDDACSNVSFCSKPEGQDDCCPPSRACDTQKNAQGHCPSSTTNLQAAGSASKKVSTSQMDAHKSDFSRISASSKPGSKDHLRRASMTSDSQKGIQGGEECSLDNQNTDSFASREASTSQLETPEEIFARIYASCDACADNCPNSGSQEGMNGNGSGSMANLQESSGLSEKVSDCNEDYFKTACKKNSSCSNLDGQQRQSQSSTSKDNQKNTEGSGSCSRGNLQAASSTNRRASASQQDEPKTLYTRTSSSTKPGGQEHGSHTSTASNTQKNVQGNRPSSRNNMQASKRVSISHPDDPKTVNSRNSTSTKPGCKDRLGNSPTSSDTRKNVQGSQPSSRTNQQPASSASRKASASNKPGSQGRLSPRSPTNKTQGTEFER